MADKSYLFDIQDMTISVTYIICIFLTRPPPQKKKKIKSIKSLPVCISIYILHVRLFSINEGIIEIVKPILVKTKEYKYS